MSHWKVELTPAVVRQLKKMDPQISKRILHFLKNRIENLEDPRITGEALQGSVLGGFWKYRVGDWRIIARLEDEILQVIVVDVGHRREIYNK